MKLRKIIVGNQSYLWKREHVHLPEFEISPCVEKITIYLERHKKSPLRLFFNEDDNQTRENSATGKWSLNGHGDGIIWLYRQSALPANQIISINFNRPAVIKNLIAYFLDRWKPSSNSKPLEIADALKCLDIIDLEEKKRTRPLKPSKRL